MSMYLYREWIRLPGAWVEVRRAGTIIRCGFVESAMPDNSALWLAADGVESRMLVEAALGYEVWVEPQLFCTLT